MNASYQFGLFDCRSSRKDFETQFNQIEWKSKANEKQRFTEEFAP